VQIEIDGNVPSTRMLGEVATNNYGHLTVMQVRRRRTRGLALHRERLRMQHRVLFGRELDVDRVQAFIRHAVKQRPDGTVRVVLNVGRDRVEHVMVMVRPPNDATAEPQRLKSVEFQRQIAQVKHLGSFAQLYQLERAVVAGYDDALFVDADGRLLETSRWNVGIVKGDSVIFPRGRILPGITMALIEQHAPAAGISVARESVPLADVGRVDAVFMTNSSGVAPVGLVDSTPTDAQNPVVAQLAQIYRDIPADQL
jgi:branched-subunit amino acid aminotransferase/4-amino-4-deoxychorismate lyase